MLLTKAFVSQNDSKLSHLSCIIPENCLKEDSRESHKADEKKIMTQSALTTIKCEVICFQIADELVCDSRTVYYIRFRENIIFYLET